jgi:sulfopyruvate decarboxylase TPP-binding subunit
MRRGAADVVYVPDNPLSHVLRIFETAFRDVRLVLATREEEAFGIAAGLYLGGRKPTVIACAAASRSAPRAVGVC